MTTKNDDNDRACDLRAKHCRPCEGGVPALEEARVAELLESLDSWKRMENGSISRVFEFANYYETMAFVNATAWISHREGHHPDLEVGYNRCRVSYITHAIGGLSENDFTCAAKMDGLLKL